MKEKKSYKRLKRGLVYFKEFNLKVTVSYGSLFFYYNLETKTKED